MAKERESEVLTDEPLIDGFTWDESEASNETFFPSPEKKDKVKEQKELLNEVKNTKEGGKRKEKENGNGGDSEPEPEPFSEGSDSFIESKNPKSDKSEGGKSEITGAEGSGTTKSENNGDLTLEVNTEDDDKAFFTTLTKEMKEKGILSAIEITEGEEIDEEKFFELQEEEVQARAEEIFEAAFEQINNDPTAVALLRYIKNGGNTYDFLNHYKDNTRLPDNLDLEKAVNQKKVLEFYYLNIEKIDPEDLEERMELLKDEGKQKKYAEKYYKIINDKDLEAKLNLATQQENLSKKEVEKSTKLRDDLQKVLNIGKGEANFEFTKEEIKDLVSFITKPAFKIGPNKFITGFQSKLGEILKDHKKMLTLAKIIKKDFVVPELTKTTETKITKKVENTLRDAKNGLKTRSEKHIEKSLADLFDEP